MNKRHSHVLTSPEIRRLLSDWFTDTNQPPMISKMMLFLDLFGPSVSETVMAFFSWVKTETEGEVEYRQSPVDPFSASMHPFSASMHGHNSRAEYHIHFNEEINLVAFILKYSGE